MDINIAKKNIITSILFRIIILALSIPVRSLMISKLGNEITGIYSLFNNIITVLNLAESGIGISIIYSMYKYIKENKKEEITGLFNLFQKYYKIIGYLIIGVGLLASLLLKFFIKENVDWKDIYIPYYLMILSTGISYFFASKISLFNAYKHNYIATTITSISYMIQYIFQILVLIFIKSFVLYSLVILFSIFVQWFLTNIVFNKGYKHELVDSKGILEESTKKEVFDNVKAMFTHKIGNVLFNATNGLIISLLINVVILGVYNNYTTIIMAIVSVLSLMFASITSVIGHAYLSDQSSKFYDSYELIKFINLVTGIVFFIVFISVEDVIIPIIFSSGIYLTEMEIFLLIASQFIQYNRQVNVVFREATGVFKYDKIRPIIEVVLNIILSLILGNLFGIVGILLSNVIITIFVTFTIEPYILYKKVFNKNYVKKYFSFIHTVFFFVLVLFIALWIRERVNDTNIIVLLIKRLLVSVGIIISYLIILVLLKKNNRKIVYNIFNKFKK